MLRRILSLLLAIAILVSCFTVCVLSADTRQAHTLQSLKQKYPQGKYWNGGNADSYTSTPCNHHRSGCKYDGSCGCNTFLNTSIQCMGFANQLAYLVYGGNPYYEWTKYYGDDAFDMIKAGDIVRYKNSTHSVFITAVGKDTLTFAECNADGHCRIDWDRTLSKSELKKTFAYVARAPYEWDVTGSDIPACTCSDTYAGKYKCVTETYPLNVRAGHGSSYAKVGTIPKGETVTVTAADGTWAHVSYGNVTGYASMEYLQLIAPASGITLDKNIMNLDTAHTKEDTLTIIKSDSLPKDVRLEFDYDKEIVSITQKDNLLSITALKTGETDLVINVSDSKGIIISVKCGIFVSAPTHKFGSYVSDDNATSDKNSTKTRTCTVCNAKESVEIAGTKLKNSSEIFSDVSKNIWYKHYVDYAYTNNIFGGMTKTEFSPETAMTRAQFVQVLANLSGIDTTDKNKDAGFLDVKSGSWYAPAVKWASENGIVGGMGDGIFAPEQKITREQMCVMLVNYVENYRKTTLSQKEQQTLFKDDDTISDWSKEKVYKCQRADLINGMNDGTFSPKNEATRAQGATIFTNFHKIIKTA